jgi:hypothetical protein
MARLGGLGGVQRSTFSTLELTPIIQQALRVHAKAATTDGTTGSFHAASAGWLSERAR